MSAVNDDGLINGYPSRCSCIEGAKMGFRVIIATVCSAFLIGYFIGVGITSGSELLGFEARILSMSWGLILAALFGLLACAIDGLIWYFNSKQKNKFIVPANPNPPPPVN